MATKLSIVTKAAHTLAFVAICSASAGIHLLHPFCHRPSCDSNVQCGHPHGNTAPPPSTKVRYLAASFREHFGALSEDACPVCLFLDTQHMQPGHAAVDVNNGLAPVRFCCCPSDPHVPHESLLTSLARAPPTHLASNHI